MTVTRYVHGADEAAPQTQPAPQEGAKVIGGALQYVVGSEQPTQRTTARFTVSHDGVPGGSVLLTRQKVAGRDTVELVPGVPGSRTFITEAVKAGLLEEHAPGLYRDAPAAEGGPSEKGEESPTQEDPGAGVFSTDEDREWATAIEPLPQSSYDSAVASGVAVVAHGHGSFEDTAKSLAKSSGMEVDEALAYVTEGYGMYERAVARGLAPLGLSGERLQAFYDSTRSDPLALQDALQRVLHQRDVSGFKAMAAAWVTKNPGPDVQALKAAGFEVFTDPRTGESLARREGGSWVSVRGLLKG